LAIGNSAANLKVVILKAQMVVFSRCTGRILQKQNSELKKTHAAFQINPIRSMA